MITALVEFGSIWFWMLVAAFALLEVIVYDVEKFTGKSFGVLAAFLVVITAFTDVKFGWLSGLRDNALTLMTVWLPAYVVAGGAWMFFRWFVFLHDARVKYVECRDKAREKYERDKTLLEKEAADRTSAGDKYSAAKSLAKLRPYDSYLSESIGYKLFPPRVSDNKERLVSWAVWWWASMLNFCLSDVLHRIGNMIVNTFHGVLQNMSDRMFANFPELKKRD